MAKMTMLRALGFKDEDIIFILGIIKADRFNQQFGELPTDAAHIVVGVIIHSQDQDPSDSWTFLDDLQDDVGIDRELYRPMYLINNHGVWLMRGNMSVSVPTPSTPSPSIPGHRQPQEPSGASLSDKMLATGESFCSQQNMQKTAADAIVKALSNLGWTIQVTVPFSAVITESSDKKTECTRSAEMQNKGRYQDNGHGVMFVPGIHRIEYTIHITDDGKNYWIEAGLADETAFYPLR